MSNQTLADYLSRHEKVLRDVLNSADIPAQRIKDGMIHSLFPGGKRFRPILVYLCGEIVGVSVPVLDAIAAAVELTHAYSLVHDDLPAMDNDDMRRGKPSCHRAFDEATAILVGDGLQAFALEILLSQLPPLLPASTVITITQTLIRASGISGMISGQSLDLSELTQRNLSEKRLASIHSLKTGCLIMACIDMVLAAREPSATTTIALREFAKKLGLVFQMQDDYLDCYGTHDPLGKGRSSDHENQKTTFATLYSQHALQTLIAQHFHDIDQVLIGMDQPVDHLRDVVQTLRHRDFSKIT